MNVWNESRSMDFAESDVCELPNLRPGEAEALSAWLSKPRLPAHPLTPMERGALGELPWAAQVAHDQAEDRAGSTYAVNQLLDARDLALQADEDRRARLGVS